MFLIIGLFRFIETSVANFDRQVALTWRNVFQYQGGHHIEKARCEGIENQKIPKQKIRLFIKIKICIVQ